MGTKYTSQATSGYNSSPPSDDGATSESNKIKWSTFKTKIGDVLKTFAEAINSQLVTTLNTSARAVSASDSAAATDHWRTIEVRTASVTVTLADASTMAAGYIVSVTNQSSGNCTVALASSTDTIDGVTNTTVTLPTKSARTYIVNAAANGYETQSGHASDVPTLSTEQATTSGTEKDFPIPVWAKKITVQLVGVSTGGTDNLLVQLGDAGGIETSGYLGSTSAMQNGAVSATNFTTGIGISKASAAAVVHGSVTLTLEDASQFTWVASGVLGWSNSALVTTPGYSKSLSAALTTVRVTTTGGTDAFSAGAVNVLYE